MLIIAFDTATPAVTVALHDGCQVIAQESAVDARRHGELLAPAVAAVLAAAESDLGLVAYEMGLLAKRVERELTLATSQKHDHESPLPAVPPQGGVRIPGDCDA